MKVDASDNLTSKSRKMFYELSDDQLKEAFSLIHTFVEDGKRFSVNDFNRYLESRIKLRSNKRKLKQRVNVKQKRIKRSQKTILSDGNNESCIQS